MSSSSLIQKLQAQLKEELEKATVDFHKVAILSKELVGQDPNSVRFTVDAGHIHRLGFELVGKQETALGELIKNAFDADASEVRVTFSNYDEPGGTLVIADNGSGMSLDTIRESWMRLSTKSKEAYPFSSKFGRSRAGRKGIGRFAVERLGKRLKLETAVEGASEGIRVQFDWDVMSQTSNELDLIAFGVERFEKDPINHGSILTISDLRDKWTDKQFERVWKSVLFLQSPTGGIRRTTNLNYELLETDPGFAVVINGESDKDIAKQYSLESSFLEERLAKFTGYVDEQGVATYALSSKKIPLEDTVTLERRFPLLGPMKFDVDYFIYGDKLITGFSKNVAQDLGKRFGGVRVYRDGFRVLPYGEQGNDWLRLDYDYARRDVLSPFGNQNFFGYVEFGSSGNPLLEETSGREGLIENEAFEELRAFIREGLHWAVLRVAAARGKKTRKGDKENENQRKPSEALDETIKAATQSSAAAHAGGTVDETTVTLPISVLQGIKEESEAFERGMEQQVADHLHYEAMLRILASLGTSISVFSHEIGGTINGVIGSVVDIEEVARDLNVEPSFKDILEDLRNSTGRLEDLSGYVLSLIHHSSSRMRKELPLHSIVNSFIKQFEQYLNNRKINFSVSVNPSHIRTRSMHRSEIDSVLFNFLTNAIKAIDRARSGERKVKIEVFSRNGFAVIGFEDSGSGVPEKIRDKVFDAFFTTSSMADDDVPGPGSGLGLKIVDDIASANGGEVELAEPSPGFKCRFEFSVPLADSQRSQS